MTGRTARVLGTLATVLACACSAPEDDAPVQQRGPTVFLRQAEVGTALGPPVTAEIGPAGGTLTSSDGLATLTVPPGALSAPVTFSVEQITSTAPGAMGSGYRFGPVDVAMPELTLAFTSPVPAPTVADLTLASQNGESFWVRYREVTRDVGAGTLSIGTHRLGDWSVVLSNTAADLFGWFTLTSTKDIPFTADGLATLNYGGDDAWGAHYLQWGTLTLRSPVTFGGATCTPVSATWDLYANVADLSVAQQRFDWGISGVWELGCDDGSAPVLTTAFDTLGVNDVGCTRGWSGAPIISLTQVKGMYVVDCGSRGMSVVDLDLRSGAL